MKRQKLSANEKMFLLLFGLAIISLLLFWVGPEFVKSRLSLWGIDDKNQGQIGDVFGGTLGPFIALIAAFLTFLAFWIQYEANKEQKKQFERQAVDTARDRFESKFYKMLEMHRDNVSSIEITKDITGRDSFEHMLLELKMCYLLIKNFYKDNSEDASPFPASDDLLYQIAYLFFFFGFKDESVEMVKELIGTQFEDLIDSVRDFLQTAIRFDPDVDDEGEGEGGEKPMKQIFVEQEDEEKVTLVWSNKYEFLGGHLNRFSHYIRHLYQTVKFVNEYSNDALNDEMKYDYITNLRAQLSVYEQALVYYNALSVLGAPWLKEREIGFESFFVKYCMVKSLPPQLVDFFKSPKAFLPPFNSDGRSLFEWSEIEKRMGEHLINNGDVTLETEG